uniref:Uncharacterized protein n=1 Tax=Graphocephala atropunctata TaxID=36148 RepID=A0A1B6KUR8_9HEMI
MAEIPGPSRVTLRPIQREWRNELHPDYFFNWAIAEVVASSYSENPITGVAEVVVETESHIPGAGRGAWATERLPGHVTPHPIQGETSSTWGLSNELHPKDFSWTVPGTCPASSSENSVPGVAGDVVVAESHIPGAGRGAWTKDGLPRNVRLGPYQGTINDEPDPEGFSWAIKKGGKIDHYVTADSTDTSNWMGFVNCARNKCEENLKAYQYQGQIYYRTFKPVPPKVELCLNYGNEFASELGISMESFHSRNTSHLERKVFTCDSCDITYTSPLYLQPHQRFCKKNRGPKILVEDNTLPRDVQTLATVIDGSKVYECPFCLYKGKLIYHIQQHLLTHTGEQKYSCNVCGNRFTQGSSLSTHKRLHREEKKYKCTLCSYSCHQIVNFKRHMRIHTREMIYACRLCKYSCSCNSNMVKHIRTHTGEKPFRCPQCEFPFATSSNRTRHVRTVHSGQKAPNPASASALLQPAPAREE